MKRYMAIMSVIALMQWIGFNAYAQNVNFEKVQVKHKVLPLQPLDKGLTTYNSAFKPVDLELSKAQSESMRLKNLVLDGYTYQEENADVTIELMLDVLSFKSRDVLDKTTTKGQGENKVTVPQFKYSINYDYPYTVKVTNNSTGAVLLEEKDYLPVSYEYPETTFADSQEKLSNMYEESKGKIINNIRRIGAEKVMGTVNELVNSQFGYTVTTLGFDLGYVKSFKKFDYTDLYGAFEKMRLGINQLEEEWYSQSLEGNPLKEALEVLNKARQEYSPGDKKSRINEKVVFMVHHNISICNFFLKDFKECESSIAAIGDKATYQMKENRTFLKKYVGETSKRFAANNIAFNQ